MSDNNQQILHEISNEQRSRQSSFEARRKRGGCLTIILLFLATSSIYGVFSAFKALIHPISVFDRSFSPFISIILVVVDLISIYGIWRWKKWGVKLFVTGYVLGALISVITGVILHTYGTFFQDGFLAAGTIVIALAVLLLTFVPFYFEVKKRWQYFS